MNCFLTLCLATLLAATPLRAETFRNPRHIPVPGNPTSVGTADFNGDHRPDFYYFIPNAPYSHPQLGILLAQSDGTYINAAAVSLPVGTGNCRAYDVNADGASDLACVTLPSETISSLSVLISNGDGTFQSPLVTPLSGGQFPYAHSLVLGPAGDLNQDGHLDLVIYDDSIYTQKTLGFLGDGAGNFPTVKTSALAYSNGSDSNATLADVNGDGHLDLLISSSFPSGPYVLLGQGDGTFIAMPPTSSASHCVFADMDKDGHLDATCSLASSTGNGDLNNPDSFYSLIILHGNPDGTFAPTPIYQSQLPFSDFLTPFSVRDLNGDGLPDILATSGDGASVYFGQPGMKFSAPMHYGFYNIGGFNYDQPDPSLVADFDQDGHLDIAMTGANGIYIAYGRADGTFDAPPIVQSGTNIGFATVADFNSDGIPDVVTSGSAALQLNIGKGDGTFAPSVDMQLSVAKPRYYDGVAAALLTGDFNGDGHADLIATNETADNPSLPHLFLGHGDSTFAPPILATSSINYVPTNRTTTVADINHDGRDDLITSGIGSDPGSSALNVFLSNGDGSFTVTSTPLPQGAFSYYNSAPAAADFNGDGKLDIIAPSNNTVEVLLGHGDGAFTLTSSALSVPLVAGSSSTYIPAVVAGDFDGDGKKDFAILATSGAYMGNDNDSGPTAIIVYYGNGDGTFSAPVTAATLDHGYLSLATADFNRDGLADFVMVTDSALGIDFDYTGEAIAVIHGLPGRSFTSETNLVAGNGLSTLAVADFNQDGFPDLLFANGNTGYALANSFVVLMNLSTPTVFGDLTVTPEPSVTSQPITLTATLYPPSGSPALLSGSIAFTIDGNAAGSATLVNNIAAITVSPALSIGTHSLTATWPGDATYPPLIFTATHTVTGIPVTISLTSTLNPATVGQQVTFLESMANAAGVSASTPGPTGTTILTDNGVTIGTNTQVSSSLPASWGYDHVFATSGQHTITATYSGDATHSPATATLIETVNPLATTTALQSSPNPSTYGQSVTFTASVTATPEQFLPNLLNSSTVTFSGLPGGPTTAPVVFSPSNSSSSVTIGFATYTTNSLPVGSYPVIATFSGNASLNPGTAATVTQIVRPAATATTLSVGPNPAYATQTVILTAHVTGVIGTPSGTIQFFDGGAPLATTALASGSASFSTALLAPGVHAITAQYSGDANNLPSTSAPIAETILPSDFTLSIEPSSTALATGHHTTVILTAASIGNFSDSLRLTVTPIPSYATITFTPATLQLTSGGKATSRINLDTDEIVGYLSKTQTRPSPSASTLAATLALIFFPLALWRRRRLPTFLALAITATLLIGATSCSGRYPSSTPPGTYNLQITATGTMTPITHTITLPLIVTK